MKTKLFTSALGRSPRASSFTERPLDSALGSCISPLRCLTELTTVVSLFSYRTALVILLLLELGTFFPPSMGLVKTAEFVKLLDSPKFVGHSNFMNLRRDLVGLTES